ncbi:beta-1,4-N-acetylgalactosaminyltransferase bre-4-like isoform X2 [Gigantopelta aegis]|nr:beta-1,4-N-acetylgalactosaminyltransferase bre-4-like isoform X2 [Gigantopelta aegis]
MVTTVVILKPGHFFKYCCLLLALLVTLEFVFNFAAHYNVSAGLSLFINAVVPISWKKMRSGRHGVVHDDFTQCVSHKPLCPEVPPHLDGSIKVKKKALSFRLLDNMNSDLRPGGRWCPPGCVSRHHVAVIIPYRDRPSHLKVFLRNIHPFLQKQQLDYTVYVIELVPNIPFNRALLFNIGFVESVKQHNYSCFIFHDVDLIPENDRNLYICSGEPRHLSVAIDKHKYRLLYSTIFGGAIALSREHFIKVNGFSNKYFGWGGEDDDMFKRLQRQNMSIIRYSSDVARYKMLAHPKDVPNPNR